MRAACNSCVARRGQFWREGGVTNCTIAAPPPPPPPPPVAPPPPPDDFYSASAHCAHVKAPPKRADCISCVSRGCRFHRFRWACTCPAPPPPPPPPVAPPAVITTPDGCNGFADHRQQKKCHKCLSKGRQFTTAGACLK
jgi:hypothetical protein